MSLWGLQMDAAPAHVLSQIVEFVLAEIERATAKTAAPIEQRPIGEGDDLRAIYAKALSSLGS